MYETTNKKSIRYQLKSFRWAFSGLSEFFRSEVKSKVHLFFTLLAITLGYLLEISFTEWGCLTISIAVVFCCEIINTALERICNCLPDAHDKQRGIIKDLGAASVLISAIMSLIIGILIFGPKLIALL